VRYLDDFVLCFQYRSDALRVHKLLEERLNQFGLELAPEKTRLIEFGRCAQRDAAKQGKKRPETFSFLGCTHYCTRNRKGNFKVERRTECKRLQRATQTIQRLIRDMLHAPGQQQQQALNHYLRGHYNYDGIAGNIQSLLRISRLTEKLWRKTLSRRSQDGEVHWEKFQKLTHSFPLVRPKLSITSVGFQAYAKL